MKKYLESIIVIRRIGLLTSILVPLVVAGMGIADVKANGYPNTLPGDATNFSTASPFALLTSSNDAISGDSFVRGNEATGYWDTLPVGAASPFTLLTSSDDTISENSFVEGDAPTTYPDTLPGGAINLGRASQFNVLTHSNDTISGNSFVQGNVGIQSGSFTMSQSSFVYGNLVYHTGVTRNISGGSRVTGRTYMDDATIDNALLDAQLLSDVAFAEPVTPRYATLTRVYLSGSSLTITGGAGEKVVLRLTDFILINNSTFTLSGTATTSFIVNVTGTFSLSGNSHISLVNVPASHVLFNIRGTGSAVSMGNSTMSGILLALNRTVNLGQNGQVTGWVIANQVNISGNSSVVTPMRNR